MSVPTQTSKQALERYLLTTMEMNLQTTQKIGDRAVHRAARTADERGRRAITLFPRSNLLCRMTVRRLALEIRPAFVREMDADEQVVHPHPEQRR